MAEDEDLAVAFARTTRGSRGRARDRLGSPASLAEWLDERRGDVGPAGEDVALRVEDFRRLRRAILTLFEGAANGSAAPDVVAAVNEASAAVPTVTRLELDGYRPVAVSSAAAGSRTAQILGAIARSAIEVVGGDARSSLRRCEAPGCGRWFVASRPRQVWCSPACGNRARVARHQARRRR